MSTTRFAAALAAAAAFAAAAAGCGGPELIVKTSPEVPAQAYFRPIRDGAGNEFQSTYPETYLGETPTEWEIPQELLGGWGYVRVDFGGGRTNDAQFQISKKNDTVVRIAAPPVVK